MAEQAGDDAFWLKIQHGQLANPAVLSAAEARSRPMAEPEPEPGPTELAPVSPEELDEWDELQEWVDDLPVDPDAAQVEAGDPAAGPADPIAEVSDDAAAKAVEVLEAQVQEIENRLRLIKEGDEGEAAELELLAVVQAELDELVVARDRQTAELAAAADEREEEAARTPDKAALEAIVSALETEVEQLVGD